MAKELQNVTMVTASLTTHSREMAAAIQEQTYTLEEMGDKVQSIAAKGAEYGASKIAANKVTISTLQDTPSNEEKQWIQVNPSCLLAYLGIRGCG